MRRIARFVMCAAVLIGVLAPAAAEAQTYVGGEAPAVEANDTAVLGETFERPEPGETRVLGETFEREEEGGVASRSFAFTGFAIGLLLLLAGGAIVAGVIMKRANGDVSTA